MKYLINHPEDFTSPVIAYFVGTAQALTGVLCEIACVCYLGTIQNPISVMISYMVLVAVVKVDDMYAGALDAAKIQRGIKSFLYQEPDAIAVLSTTQPLELDARTS